jgi:hypothetical protein
MSEEDFGYFDVDLALLDIDKVIFATGIEVGKAEMVLAAHQCDIPEHANGAHENLIILLIRDEEDKITPVVFHPRSSVAADIGSGVLGIKVTLVADTC